MSSRKMDNIFGQIKSEGNTTLFHLIAEDGAEKVLDRIWNATEQTELSEILKMKNNDGDTCLHTAAKNLKGRRAEVMMAQLFDMGADMDAQDGRGDTVLHIAAKQQDYELVEWLLSLSIKTNIKNNDGLTAYKVAEQNDDHKMMEMFVSANVNIAEC